ncbi:MAG: Lrp/AsnC family transcriptional regulator [Methylococcales bacterium]|jgi:transcriptional regulator, AsnC family|nr:Lrp/AsnC family transcriptional regulator [Methylococcaceae bacterium]
MIVDEVDKQIILATQAGLPLVAQPYQAIAAQLDLTAEEVMQRMRIMQENGIIRRVGAVPNHYKLGYRYNGMTVWDVVDEQIDYLGQLIGQLDFVSHCYHRPRHLPEWPYNLFAMVHSKTKTGVTEKVNIISQELGEFNRQQEVLYSTRILKKTGLRIGR